MPAPAPTVVDSPRPIHVYAYPPTPARLPDALVDLFLRELSTEPHHNDFFCDTCGRAYMIAAQEGKSCTRPQEGTHICYGKITRRWTKQKAHDELLRLMAQGGVAVAWEPARPPVPVGMMVCELHRSDSVIGAIDFPMTALGSIYGKFGRGEPFLVVTHAWLDRVAPSQEEALMRKLLDEVVEPVMRSLGLTDAVILVPVSSRDTELRHQALARMFGGKHQMLARDVREGRHRELWGIKLRAS